MFPFEDHEAVIVMIIHGRGPDMRHVSRKHRVDLDMLFARVNQDSNISSRNVNTKEQISDILTRVFL